MIGLATPMTLVATMACRPASNDTDLHTEDTDRELGPVLFAQPADAVDEDPSEDVVHVTLVAAPYEPEDDDAHDAHGERDADDDHGESVAFAYNDQVPGPTIRANLGDTIVVDFTNDLDEPTTIHWHGVAVPWEMDGITWMQDPIDPGESFTYTFEANVAGTFWYHPHFDGAAGQLDRGLYAALVVTDPADPVPDQDLVMVLDAGAEHADEEEEDHAGHHGLRPLPGPWTVNGLLRPLLSIDAGSTVRARVLNASDTGYLDLRWADPRHIGGEQGVLAAVDEPDDGLVLAPGDRADLELLIGAEGFTLSTAAYTLAGGTSLGETEDLLEVSPEGAMDAPEPLPWAFSGEAASDDPPYTDITWVFQGDGDAWFINGERYPDVTAEELALDSVAVVELRNLSATEHPFHLHGHSFEVLSVDGVPPPYRQVEDTVNVPIQSIVRIRLIADNPGDWMAHCHILPHPHQGMMTILRVTAGR